MEMPRTQHNLLLYCTMCFIISAYDKYSNYWMNTGFAVTCEESISISSEYRLNISSTVHSVIILPNQLNWAMS